LLSVTKASKQKDAAGLGALAYAYSEGDRSMLDCVPDQFALRLVAEALKRPTEFFEWVIGQSKVQESTKAILSAQRYLAVATWQWDKACILAGALLATTSDMVMSSAVAPTDEFPYWVALDKHTPEGKTALSEIAREIDVPYRQLIWASFYFESTSVNRLSPSVWWDAEKAWRLRRSGLSLGAAEDLWSQARPLVRLHLEGEASSLKKFVETAEAPWLFPAREKSVPE
jgi:hypothetical protein